MSLSRYTPFVEGHAITLVGRLPDGSFLPPTGSERRRRQDNSDSNQLPLLLNFTTVFAVSLYSSTTCATAVRACAFSPVLEGLKPHQNGKHNEVQAADHQELDDAVVYQHSG